MWAEERHNRILTLLNNHRRVEADALAKSLNVSRETVRRDLKTLEERGLVRRTHGGALIARATAEEPFVSRRASQMAEKQAMALKAVSLVEPGNCCFVDAGSTTNAFAAELAKVPNVSVITNSLDVAAALRNAQPTAEVLLLGGALARDVPATYGEITLAQLRSFRADLAFISPVGIDAGAGVTYFDLAEAEVARAMLAQAQRRVVLADHKKCGLISRVLVSECAEIDVLVSDLRDGSAFRHAGIDEFLHAPVDQAGQGIENPRMAS